MEEGRAGTVEWRKHGGPPEEDGVELPGFRFRPTDEELVGFYLRRKVGKKPLGMELIRQVDIYKHDPWDLAGMSNGAGETEWYFFCRRGRKYRNSVRPNRVTGSGFWKATGVDRPVYSSDGTRLGLKKSLVYYIGTAGKGTKTDWMMHEFRYPPGKKADEELAVADDDASDATMGEAEIWTICRIFKRSVPEKRVADTMKQDASSKSSEWDIDCEEDACGDHLAVLTSPVNNNYLSCPGALEGVSWEELGRLAETRFLPSV